MEEKDLVGQVIFGSLQNDAPDRGHSNPTREEDGRTSGIIVESQVAEWAFDLTSMLSAIPPRMRLNAVSRIRVVIVIASS
jgi:hypothetical protein